MNSHFTKIAERDGATLWEFKFQCGPHPLFAHNYSLKVATKDGRAQVNFSSDVGMGDYFTSEEMSEEDFDKKFQDFLDKMQRK